MKPRDPEPEEQKVQPKPDLRRPAPGEAAKPPEKKPPIARKIPRPKR